MARVAAAVIEADGIIVGTGSRSWVLPVTHEVDYINPAHVRDGTTVEKEATGRRKRRTNQQGHKQDTGLLHVDSMPPPSLVSREKAWAPTKKPLPHSSVHAQDVCYKEGDIDVLPSSRFAPLWVSEDKPTFINMRGHCLPREQTFPVHAYMPFPRRSRPQSPVPHASDATAPCFPRSQANPRPEPVHAV